MWDQGRDCQTRVVYYFISPFFKLCISAEMVISFCLHYSYCHSLSDYTEPREKEPLFIHLHSPIPCHRAGPHSHTVNTFVEKMNEGMNEWQRYSITRERYIVFVFFLTKKVYISLRKVLTYLCFSLYVKRRKIDFKMY